MVMSAMLMTMKAVSKEIPAGEFKAKCLALLDRVEQKKERFIVTKRGRPVAQVIPLASTKARSLRGSLIYEEDLLAPVAVVWNAMA
jgi:prevent-host-death family protein